MKRILFIYLLCFIHINYAAHTTTIHTKRIGRVTIKETKVVPLSSIYLSQHTQENSSPTNHSETQQYRFNHDNQEFLLTKKTWPSSTGKMFSITIEIENDSCLVGTSIFETNKTAHEGWLSWISIHDRFRKTKLGRALLATILDCLKHEECNKVGLYPINNSEDFYKKYGAYTQYLQNPKYPTIQAKILEFDLAVNEPYLKTISVKKVGPVTITEKVIVGNPEKWNNYIIKEQL